ncbi:MAG TPA: type II secretion system F family protein [Candidatus Saccharimonadales bacterium]|nr:type II secretion system F family protein [Candidatus Saccharimonadales bacterium]
MLTFDYEAKNASTGEKVKAKVQADSEQAAAKLLREQGLTPLTIKAEKTSVGSYAFGRIKSKDKVLFSRQLSTLINAGLPLSQSLRSVVEQTTNKALKSVISEIINDVEGGSSFSKALEKHPKVFNRVYISLVAASETSGTLDKGLERLAFQQEKDAEIMAKVRGALIYPAIVLLVMVAVVTFMIVKVLPQVQSIYASIPGVTLPFVTRLLLAISHFVTRFWWVTIILIGLAGFFGTRWARTSAGRSIVDEFKMKGWPIGTLYMKLYMARFARTGTTLTAAGVPIIQVLEVTAEAVDNVHIAKSLERAIEKVKGGKALSEALTGDPNFLELVPNMLHIGEQSGAIESMMEKVADYYEKEVDNEVKAISTIIEPVLMVVMGIVALIIVAAILLPIYGLVNQSGFTNAV